MSQCGLELTFPPAHHISFPFQSSLRSRFWQPPPDPFLSLPRLVSSMSDQIPILSIRLDFLEELPDDSVRHAMGNIRLRRCQIGGLQSAKIIQARSLFGLSLTTMRLSEDSLN